MVVEAEDEADGVVVKRTGKDASGGWLLLSVHPACEPAPWPADTEVVGEVKWMARAFREQLAYTRKPCTLRKCEPASRVVTVKNITLSANENLIEAARRRAVAEHTTLNEQFRLWLENYVRREQLADEAMIVIRELQGGIFTGGQKFTRDEMNER